MSAEDNQDQDTGWADDVDYGDDDEDDNNNEPVEKMQVVDDDESSKDKEQPQVGWADDVDYGDDDDDDDQIGDLGLTDDDINDDDLPPDDAMVPIGQQNQFKSEITSELENPNKVGISFQLLLDTKETPADISDDDETAPGLKINQFQLTTASDNKESDTMIGSGSFAKVFRARNTRNGRMVALKCMYKNLLRKQFLMKSRYDLNAEDDAPITVRHTMLDAVQIELQIMMKVKHINILRLLYIIDDPTKDSLYLALEFSPYGQVMDFHGKLLQYIPNERIMPREKYTVCDLNVPQPWWYAKYVAKGDEDESKSTREKVERFNEETAKKLIMDCVKGIAYLQSVNIIHRDLKPENLLLFKDDLHESGLMLKIADFGTAEQFNSREEAILIDTQGTYHFMSPAAIGGDKRDAFYDDVWSLGIILYALIYGTVPFFHPLDYQLFESIQNDPLVLPDKEVLSASDQVRDLIEKILVKEDEQRIKLSDIEKHAWFDGYVHPQYPVEPEPEENDDVEMYNSQRDADDTCCVVL